MKNKINVRLVGIAIIAIIATLIGITFVYYSLLKNQVRADLSVSAKLLKDTHFFESQSFDIDKIDLSTGIDELRVTWVGEDGQVLYDNDASISNLSNHMDRPEIAKAFETGEGEAVRRSDTMDENTFYYAILLDNGTVLRVATDVQSIWSVLLSATPIVIFIILIIIGLCVALSNMLTKQLIRPIETMAKNLENSDYESPYKELEPITKMLRTQHTDILSAAKARQDFTANISHELKTPLTAISGYAELLEGDMVGEEQKKHFYTEIKKNSNRLFALINDTIRLSELDGKAGFSAFEEVDLYSSAKECMDGLSVSAKQRGVSITLEGDRCLLRGNKDMLKELIENLVGNAIRYNNPGGRVLISVEKINERAVLTVEDNGIGIPESDIQRVFERFYRVDKSRSKATGGTGLGLAIVKHIVEIHDAKIELKSALSKGTTVIVTF